MLLWESLKAERARQSQAQEEKTTKRVKRLPYDHRCAATTKAGRRCKGRICEGTEFCAFHKPGITREQRQQNGAKGGSRSRYLATLPGGYLAKISTRRSVGEAMDRLYREVRTGLVTPEMGNVLFAVLTRMLDSGLVSGSETDNNAESAATGEAKKKRQGRSRAERIRPKLANLLTQAERRAWRTAVHNAPDSFLRGVEKHQENVAKNASKRRSDSPVALPAAS